MQNLYDFEQYEPIKLNEEMLKKELERRKTNRQIILLCIGAVLCCMCFVLSAFAVAKLSVIASVVIIGMFCVYLSGCGLAGVLFYRRRDRYIDFA